MSSELAIRPNPILQTPIRIIDPDEFEAPAVFRSEQPAPRGCAMKTLFRQQSAKDFIGKITPGFHIFGLSKGQFSLVDVIREVSDQVGPCDFALSVWTVAKADLGALQELLHASRFTGIRFLLDFSFQRRQPALIAHVRKLFGNASHVITKNHCKFALFGNAQWKITCRTSMNLNFNPRLEDVELKDDPALYAFLDQILLQMFARHAPKRQKSATSRALAAEFKQLEFA